MSVTLHNGDCLRWLKGLDAGSVDAVVTDPPYGMRWNTDSTRFSGGNGKRRDRRGRKWGGIAGDDRPFDPAPWLGFRKVILWGSNHFAANLPVGTTLLWIKRNDHAFGTFLSDAEVGWQKGGHGVYCCRVVSSPTLRAIEGGGKAVHPTQKPLALMRWCIERLKLKPGATILDPYMGSGTTGVAAVQLGFNFLGCEVDPAYHAIARRRIAAALADAAPMGASA